MARSAQLEVHIELHPRQFRYGLINGFQFCGFIYYRPEQEDNP